MKTQTISKIVSLKTLITVIFTATLLSASAQNKGPGRPGLRASSTISANRFGAIFAPSAFYLKGRNTFVAGVTMQSNRYNITGVQASYEYTLLDPCLDRDCNLEWLELYAFTSGGYHKKVFLGKGVCEEERQTNVESGIDVSNLKLKALEGYVGFGTRITLVKNLRWFSAVGIGGYAIINPVKGLYYNNKGLGLLIRTGLSYTFIKQNKVNF